MKFKPFCELINSVSSFSPHNSTCSIRQDHTVLVSLSPEVFLTNEVNAYSEQNWPLNYSSKTVPPEPWPERYYGYFPHSPGRACPTCHPTRSGSHFRLLRSQVLGCRRGQAKARKRAVRKSMTRPFTGCKSGIALLRVCCMAQSFHARTFRNLSSCYANVISAMSLRLTIERSCLGGAGA